jgi:hypothetical protein
MPPLHLILSPVKLTMADVKRHLADRDQHVNTAQLNADRSKHAKTNGIALDDSTVFSFLRDQIVDSIVADTIHESFTRSNFSQQFTSLNHGLYKDIEDHFRIRYARLWRSLMMADLSRIESSYGSR